MSTMGSSDHETAMHAGEGAWITVNGERRRLAPSGTLAQVLHALGITPETAGVAVAVNGEVVPRATWPARRLTAGDEVEVVRAVPGG